MTRFIMYTFIQTPISPYQGVNFTQALCAHTIKGVYVAVLFHILSSIKQENSLTLSFDLPIRLP
jgi:capsular polysaccharide biosynthesis protein